MLCFKMLIDILQAKKHKVHDTLRGLFFIFFIASLAPHLLTGGQGPLQLGTDFGCFYLGIHIIMPTYI